MAGIHVRSFTRIFARHQMCLSPHMAPLSSVGSLRQFCNKSKKKTNKNVKTKGKVNENESVDADFIANLIDTAQEVQKTRSRDLFSEEELEEHARIGREYNRQRMIQDNQINKDLSTKIWLQQEAMRALPDHLRKHAEVVDEEPPPRDRPYPIWYTPPIPGANFKDTEEDMGGLRLASGPGENYNDESSVRGSGKSAY